MTDEELQQQIEAGQSSHQEDSGLYERLFQALKKEPAFHVSLPFADRVLARIEKKEEQRDFRWLAVGIALTVIALIVSLILTQAFTTGVFSFISGYPGLVVFGICFILILHTLDRKYLKKYKGVV